MIGYDKYQPLFISEGVPYGFDLKYSGTLSKLQQEIPVSTFWYVNICSTGYRYMNFYQIAGYTL